MQPRILASSFFTRPHVFPPSSSAAAHPRDRRTSRAGRGLRMLTSATVIALAGLGFGNARSAPFTEVTQLGAGGFTQQLEFGTSSTVA
ncbi:MAG: hypothetical protein KC729_16155, partial [Candidatus Eisenbacteria bacterium]|nr:hypothetical protein [Candidatus Eisenbacteria bacterium]